MGPQPSAGLAAQRLRAAQVLDARRRLFAQDLQRYPAKRAGPDRALPLQRLPLLHLRTFRSARLINMNFRG